MWTRLLLKGIAARTVPEPLLRYRIRAGEGNLSAPTDAALSRSFFEIKRMLRAYRGIVSVAELRGIFPEVDHIGYQPEDEFTPFYLAFLGIYNDGSNQVTRFFWAELLLELMADTGFRARIAKCLGFELPDLFRTLGTLDPFGIRVRRELLESLESIRRSRSWRLTRPLRALSALGDRLLARLPKSTKRGGPG